MMNRPFFKAAPKPTTTSPPTLSPPRCREAVTTDFAFMDQHMAEYERPNPTPTQATAPLHCGGEGVGGEVSS